MGNSNCYAFVSVVLYTDNVFMLQRCGSLLPEVWVVDIEREENVLNKESICNETNYVTSR